VAPPAELAAPVAPPEPATPAAPHVAYVVRSWPRLTQTFVLDEVLALERLGLRLRIFALSRPDDPLVQPELGAVRAAVSYLEGRRGWRVVVDHLVAALAAPAPYLGAAWYVATRTEVDRGYRSSSRADCFTMAVRLAGQIRADRRHGRAPARLHAHFAHDPALVALLAHRLTGVPWSFTAHARDLWQVPSGAVAERVGSARVTVACCQAGAEHLRELVGPELRERVRLVHHGVDVRRFQPAPREGPRPPGPPRIVSVGRLVEKKGHDDLLAACRLLKDRGQRFQLDVYGDGPLRERLEAEIARLDLGDEVALLGARPRGELLPALQAADVFALTPAVTPDGDRDGIPNVLLEAMACGLPVVTTAVGGIGEVVTHGSSGLLAPPHDVDAIAGQLRSLLVDEGARRRIGEVARRTVVEGFDARDASAELADLLAPGVRSRS
jgi:glycosyltransferase involved in cell wall biosynthesis